MTEQFPSELISWAGVQQLTRKLSVKICRAGFKPEVAVAVARGGYVPARLLCDSLDLADLRSIRIVHYLAGARKQQKAKLVDTLCQSLEGKRVLLVDDVSDTGDTLELAVQHLEDFGAEEIRIAVLHHKKTSPVTPDFYAQLIVKWRWIIYPWAVREDLTGFIEQLPHRPDDAEEVAALLNRYYGLRISRSRVEEVLFDLPEVE